VPAHVHIGAQGREVLRLHRFQGAGVEVQSLRRLREAEALAFAPAAQPRAGAAALLAANFACHERQPRL